MNEEASFMQFYQSVKNTSADALAKILNRRFEGLHVAVDEAGLSDISTSRSFNSNQYLDYDNLENFRLQLRDFMKEYVRRKDGKDLIDHLYERTKLACSDLPGQEWDKKMQLRLVDKLNQFLTRLDVGRLHSEEVNICLWLLLRNNDQAVKLFLRLSEKVNERCDSNMAIRNQSISNYNLNKYSRSVSDTLDQYLMSTQQWAGIVDNVLTQFLSNLSWKIILQAINQAFMDLGEVESCYKATTMVFASLFLLQNNSNTYHYKVRKHVQQPVQLAPLKLEDSWVSKEMLSTRGSISQSPLKLSDLSLLQRWSSKTVDEQSSIYKLDRTTTTDYTYKLNQKHQTSPEQKQFERSKRAKVVKRYAKEDLIVSQIRREMVVLSLQLRTQTSLKSTV